MHSHPQRINFVHPVTRSHGFIERLGQRGVSHSWRFQRLDAICSTNDARLPCARSQCVSKVLFASVTL